MKITIDKEDGSTPLVISGEAAKSLTRGVRKLYKQYQISEKMINHSFDKLLNAMRARAHGKKGG